MTSDCSLPAVPRRAAPFAALALVAAPLAAPLAAQAAERAPAGGLDVIIVTAQHRQEDQQDVPIAVSALDGGTLREAGIDVSRELPQAIPGLQFTRSGASGLFFLRGVGTTNAAAGEEGANAVYVDGVYLGDLGQTIASLYAVERIEVLKGPQGTLFGRNATGGLIHIITREPGDEPQLNASLAYGNRERVETRLHAATPLAPGVALGLAATYANQGEGWARDITLGRDVQTERYGGVRGKLVLRPSDAVKLVLAGDLWRSTDNLGLAWKIKPGVAATGIDRNGDGIAEPIFAPAGRDTASNDFPLTRQRIGGTSLTAVTDLGFAELTAISAYRRATNRSVIDVDGGLLPLVRIDFAAVSRTFQQEVRLASSAIAPVSWQAGLFLFRARAANDSSFSGSAFAPALGQVTSGRLASRSYAAFGEATWAIAPHTRLTGGLRTTVDRKHLRAAQALRLAGGTMVPAGTATIPGGRPLAQPGVQLSRLAYTEVTWRIALRQDIGEDASVYASVNRGFKSGSFSLQNPLNDPYRPQFVTAFEAGAKAELFERRLRLNLAAFHYRIAGYQIRSAAVAAPGASLVLNAATVRVDGAELEFEAAPVDRLRLFGGMTALHSRFHRFGGPGAAFQAPIVYPNANSGADPLQHTRCPAALLGTRDPGVVGSGPLTGGYTTCFGDVSGNATPNAPRFAASLGASYSLPVGATGELRVSALYSYNSGYAFEADNIHRQGAFSLVNAAVEYRPTEQLGLELWVRNLADTRYAVQELTTATGTTQALGAPRSWGLRLSLDY